MLNLAHPREQATAPAFWPLAGAAFAVAVALSSMRLVAAPGFEFWGRSSICWPIAGSG